jgi:hypothetical protein
MPHPGWSFMTKPGRLPFSQDNQRLGGLNLAGSLAMVVR